MINKIGRPRSGSPICLITSMITDRIGLHEVLLPINHNFNKIFDTLDSFFLIKTQEIPRFFLLAVKKKSHFSARVMARTVNYLGMTRSLTNSRGSRVQSRGHGSTVAVTGPLSRSWVQCRSRGSKVAFAGPMSRQGKIIWGSR